MRATSGHRDTGPRSDAALLRSVAASRLLAASQDGATSFARGRLASPMRDAWRRHYATQREPWRGPLHAAPLLAGLSGRILELGAAGGKVGRALPPDALALDWVGEALPTGRPAMVADVTALPLRDASVDALVAIHVLGHLEDPAAALGEWARVLRSGGVLVLETFAVGDARDVPGHAATRDGMLTRYFDERELRDHVAAAGFSGDLACEERTQRWGTRRVLRGRLVRA